eukprot:scaffold77439_cov57-Phaeocystis_antarctica.AAC.2
MVCAGCSALAPRARVNCSQSSRPSSVRASSCPTSGGSAFSGQLLRRRLVRASSCPSSAGSSFSCRHAWRLSSVRACSCPISGASAFSLLFSKSSSWTRSSLHVTPFHERGLSPSGHRFCSAELAARIAHSTSSSGSGAASCDQPLRLQ